MEHRDLLVTQLMVASRLSAAMPIAAFLRRDLPLFFETFEAFKVGGSSASAGLAMVQAAPGIAAPGLAALADQAPASTAAPVSASTAAAVLANPADLALADIAGPMPTMDVIKVSPPKNHQTMYITLDGIAVALIWERIWKSSLQEINPRQIRTLRATSGFEWDDSPGINCLGSGSIGT
jgi:hypothetical protein